MFQHHARIGLFQLMVTIALPRLGLRNPFRIYRLGLFNRDPWTLNRSTQILTILENFSIFVNNNFKNRDIAFDYQAELDEIFVLDNSGGLPEAYRFAGRAFIAMGLKLMQY